MQQGIRPFEYPVPMHDLDNVRAHCTEYERTQRDSFFFSSIFSSMLFIDCSRRKMNRVEPGVDKQNPNTRRGSGRSIEFHGQSKEKRRQADVLFQASDLFFQKIIIRSEKRSQTYIMSTFLIVADEIFVHGHHLIYFSNRKQLFSPV